MVEAAATILSQLVNVILSTAQNLAVMAVAFSLAARYCPKCNPGAPWWRKPDLAVDLSWALLPRLLNTYAYLMLLALLFSLAYGLRPGAELVEFMAHGRGPLSGLGFWPQVAVYLVGNDLLMYATHRAFHTARLWRFHAIHHGTKHLEWISATRFHPVDQLFHASLADIGMLLLGVSPEVLAWLAPWTVGSSALVHANLDWTFGPLRYVLVSPVFHRWHHTSADRGGSSNFAGTFAFLDLVFGTFYMPDGERPDRFGVDDTNFPAGFWGQLAYPFLPGTRLAPSSVKADARSG